MKPQESSGDDYELTPSGQTYTDSAEPLLPRYERHDTPLVIGRSSYERRKSRFRRTVSCLCLTVMIAVPTFGFMGCYFGETTLDKIRSWDQVPPEWKEWLNQYGPKQAADHANFPTK